MRLETQFNGVDGFLQADIEGVHIVFGNEANFDARHIDSPQRMVWY